MTKCEKSIVGLGVDQGIANCGYSIIRLSHDGTIQRLKSGTIETNSKLPLPQRMTLLYSLLTELVDKYRPVIIGCEKLFFNPKQKGRNKSAAIVYTNMATGLLCLIAGQNQIKLEEYVPGTVKKCVTGNGRAQKEDIEQAIRYLIDDKNRVLSHETDAIAIGITAVLSYQAAQREQSDKQNKRKRRE
ncbi:crossover junction endodeoxyribonuclease RuvC (plasmid) [Paenibacillus thiaminolyticus]|uniref:crossover junction endodeoxyribonuclease RuvC n=1 Tax=Paenibacillus thiaminolyticus TaxID=49283 RepID=UPI00232E9BD7|nr:crossover junction endodeoxyribonuclease RuvC [Paenibacillus thiaminolyticus]WCF11440.1 crossover junction endodeoxyribonuclease RuvC [Paenibacillus thiaminolyticus]